jgi:hypothetical protein
MDRPKLLEEKTIAARGVEAQLPRWMQMAKTVPVMRLDKVLGTRKAMEMHALDSDDVLDITIERLSEDLGLGEPTDDGEPVG